MADSKTYSRFQGCFSLLLQKHKPAGGATDFDVLQDWMIEFDEESWNTRVWKRSDPSQHCDLPEYEVRVASARCLPTKTYRYKNKCVIHLVYGDHKEDLRDLVMHLKNAIPYTDKDDQREMIIW
ncbi:hypothetical protein R1flu_023048 [Riccia fluitans]|uniref:Uncharacterized protein n=1 Tax=Riccia fluitans TaxID=41844 RepID=A0ABD1XTW1_9MARC